ncbi:MAG: dethiobiotin synthase [Gammaproteobacteria bacterium]
MAKGFFITGTDTGVGKTIITASLIKLLSSSDLKVAGMKPIASGCYKTSQGLRNEDAVLIMQQSNLELDYDLINPYAFEPPISPHFAAKDLDQKIDIDNILEKYSVISNSADVVLVEGVGGWQVPINEDQHMSDLAVALKLPVIMVVGLRLGCINHALLTAQAIRKNGLDLIACVANLIDADYAKVEETVNTLKKQLNIPVEFVPHIDQKEIEQMNKNKLIPEIIINSLEKTKEQLYENV